MVVVVAAREKEDLRTDRFFDFRRNGHMPIVSGVRQAVEMKCGGGSVGGDGLRVRGVAGKRRLGVKREGVLGRVFGCHLVHLCVLFVDCCCKGLVCLRVSLLGGVNGMCVVVDVVEEEVEG